MTNLSNQKCVPCEAGSLPMTQEEAAKELQNIKDWRLEESTIVKDFKFKDFTEAMSFVNKIATIAEEEGHHPDIFISYNKVTVTLTTHASKGLSLNDFIVAAKVDTLE